MTVLVAILVALFWLAFFGVLFALARYGAAIHAYLISHSPFDLDDFYAPH